MKVVVDTNIVFSGLLRTNGKIGDLLMNSEGLIEFHACDVLRAELTKHRLKLLEFSSLSDLQLDQAEYQILKRINFTNESLIPFEFWMKAVNLVRDIDMNDVAFITLSEYLNVKLWTGDKVLIQGLKKKGFTNVINTDELFAERMNMNK